MSGARLTRRDRALYEVALHAARAHIAGLTLEIPADDPLFIDASLRAWVLGERLYLDTRIARARLALYLRAVLRADAGDFGPFMCGGPARLWMSRRITPLWSLAPAHARRPRGV